MNQKWSYPQGQRRSQGEAQCYIRTTPAVLLDVVVVEKWSSIVRDSNCESEREERKEGDPPPVELLSHGVDGLRVNG